MWGVSIVNFLWPVVMVVGFSMIFTGLGGLDTYSTNGHIWATISVLGACVLVGSVVYGHRNDVRECRRDMAELAACPVWYSRNSPPGECTCGGCRP